MKRFYLLTLFLISMVALGYGQFSTDFRSVTDNIPKASNSRLSKKSASNPKACSRDTVEYPRYKASRLYFVNMKSGYSLGQFYGAPQDITIHGFTFYGFVNSNPPTDKKIRVICNIYKAGADSLPSGTPLRSDTITLDSTLGGGVLSKVVKHATFRSPVTVNYPYILTVESDSNSNTAIVTNDWTAGDGERKNYFCGSVSGRWYRGLSLNIGGRSLDADVLLHPHVSYKFGTDFTFKDCSDYKDTARFKNLYRSNVSGSYFYNVYSFYPYDWFCHQWNYGDQPWNTYEIDGLNDYQSKDNYQVRLISRVFQWHLTNGGNTQCVDTTIKIYYFKPRDPYAVSNTNICRGDSANIMVASDPGVDIKWYKNPSDINPVFTGTINRLGIIQANDTFYLKAVNKHCESGFSRIVVSVNDYPKHPIIKNDSICTGARANLEAISATGITEWFLDSTRLPVLTGNLYQTAPLNQTQTFFVRSNNRGCHSPHFLSVSAFVDNNFAPEDPIISSDTIICLRPAGEAILSAYSLKGDSIKWYDAPSGGKSIGSGNTFTYKAHTKEVKTLYTEAQKSTCASSRLGIKVTVSDYPGVTTVFNDEKCKGDTAVVGVMLSSFGDVHWYSGATGGTPISTGTVIKHHTLKSKSLYAEVSENGCINPVRTKVQINILSIDSITQVQIPIVCGSEKAVLKVVAGTSTVKWYDDQEATQLLSTSPTFTTPKLVVSRYYYYTLEKSGCKSPVYEALVEVLPLPIPGFRDSIVKGHKIRFTPYTNTGVRYKWDMGDGNSFTTKLVTYGYASYGTYQVKLTVTSLTSGCMDSLSRWVVFDFSGIKQTGNPQLSISPNPNNGQFRLVTDRNAEPMYIKIVNTEGQPVYEKLISGADHVVLEDLPVGLYYLSAETTKGVMHNKFMVVK